MPMPIELPVIDWKEVFNSGLPLEKWLAAGEIPDNVQAIRLMLDDQSFSPEVEAGVAAIDRPVHVVAIAEDWCPDVIRHVPVLEKMATLNANISVRYVTRVQWLDVFMRFLTVGGEAIPKFVFLSEDFVECGDWGPMPEKCREYIARGKAYGDNGKARTLVFQAYAEDPDRNIPAQEILHRLEVAASSPPF